MPILKCAGSRGVVPGTGSNLQALLLCVLEPPIYTSKMKIEYVIFLSAVLSKSSRL